MGRKQGKEKTLREVKMLLQRHTGAVTFTQNSHLERGVQADLRWQRSNRRSKSDQQRSRSDQRSNRRSKSDLPKGFC